MQETFLRAWRGREGIGGPGQYRAWLYRIATSVCLDSLRSRRSVPRLTSFAEVPWLQPYPDTLLDQVKSPEETAIRRETISLAFLAALQALPPRQRAALIARDVLGWPASETAATLGTTVAAANSAHTTIPWWQGRRLRFEFSYLRVEEAAWKSALINRDEPGTVARLMAGGLPGGARA